MLSPRAAPWAVLAVALALRLWQIDLTRFYNDAVRLMDSANDFVSTGHIPLRGGIPLSIGSWLPPLISYLLALPAVVSPNPLWVSSVLAVLDACGALLVYAAAKRLTSSTGAGVAAGLAYAVAPAALVYGRMIWNVTFVPVFAALALWGLIDFHQQKRSLSLALSLAAIVAIAELHFANGIYGLLWLAVALAGWRCIRWLHLAIAGAVLLALTAPYLILQLQTNWADLYVFSRFMTSTPRVDPEAVGSAAALTGTASYWQLLPLQAQPGWFDLDPLTWLAVALTIVGAGFVLASRRSGQAIALAWLVLPIVFTVRHSMRVAPWYLLGQVPAVALLQGLGIIGLVETARRLQPRAARVFPAAALALLAVPIWAYANFMDQVASIDRPASYGIPLRYSMAAARQIESRIGPELMYFAGPQDHSEVVPYLLGLPSFRYYSGRSVIALPKDQAWYLTQASTLASDFLAARFGPPSASVQTSRGAPEFHLFRVPGEQAVLSDPDFKSLQADLAPGIRLGGYAARSLAAGQPSALDLVWRVTDGPALAGLHLSQYAHLSDRDGQGWSTAPDIWDISEPWTTGQLVVSPFELNIRADAPLGGYWLETGFYQTFSQEPFGKPLRIGPLRVAAARASNASGEALATFGDGELALLKADWQGPEVALQWRALAEPRASYTVFVHAVNRAGQVVAQQDSTPLRGSFPTTLWQPGDVIQEVYNLGVAPAAGLELEIGLYTQPDVKRLPVHQPSSATVRDHVTLPSL